MAETGVDPGLTVLAVTSRRPGSVPRLLRLAPASRRVEAEARRGWSMACCVVLDRDRGAPGLGLGHEPVHLAEVIDGPFGQGGAERQRRFDRDQAVVRPLQLAESGVEAVQAASRRSRRSDCPRC